MKFCQVEKQCSVTLIQLRNNRKKILNAYKCFINKLQKIGCFSMICPIFASNQAKQ